MELKTKLVRLRKQKGLSQLELAEKLNVSRQAVSRWEVGDTVPSTENFKYLARLYEVSLEYLIDDQIDDQQEPKKAENIQEHYKKEAKYRNKKFIIVLISIVLCVAVLIVFYSETRKQNDGHWIQDIKRSEITTDKETDFDLEW